MLSAASIKSCSYSSAVANTVSPKSLMPLALVMFIELVLYVRDEPISRRYRYGKLFPVISPLMTEGLILSRNRVVSFIPVILPVIIDEPRLLRSKYVSFIPVISPVIADEPRLERDK